MSDQPKAIPKVLHQGRLVTVFINGWREDLHSPSGRVIWSEQLVCYDTTVDDVKKAVMDSLLSKGFVSADELRPDWKDRISQ